VYPGAEVDRFDPDRLMPPAAARARLGLPAAGPIIGIVSRLQRWKGIHVVIDAMDLLRRTHSTAHCIVVGGRHALEPHYEDDLERQIASLGLTEQVTLVGLQANVPEWMQAMDVIVHASDQEPFGIVVIEAMALGKPVIAGSGGGPAEIITDGVDGLLVPYGDVIAMAGALRRFLDDPSFAAQVGAAARERASEFSDRRYAENLIATLKELSS
jgi:glycosyltransferase involved in cell wall biosynthesis